MDMPENVSSVLSQHISYNSYYTQTSLVSSSLKAKLCIPPLQPNIISRTHLIKRLDVGMQNTVTLISASAGFGKTTLLSEWASRTQSPISWISLDESDNNLIRFWYYVVASLETLYPKVGQELLELLRLPHSNPIEEFMSSLINELETIQEDIALVLDNYHIIDNSLIHHSIAFFIQYLPSHIHLFISSRVYPPLSLARLRVRCKLNELDGADLLFTSTEVDTFLTQAKNLELGVDAINSLKTRTEGWIAGLQLVVHALQKCVDTSHFIVVCNGNHRYIQDYVTDEVLRELPENTRAFLFQTCILERLNSSLCNAVTGQDNSQFMLELLERMNLFLVSLDNYRHWYRYHRLFRDSLYESLQHMPQEQIRVLHRRAYEWYEKNAFKAEAVHHALAAMDNEYAAKLIARFGEEMMKRNEIAMVRQWLESLPIDIIRSRPRLCLLQAWMLIATNQFDNVEIWMQEAQNGLGKDDGELSVDSSYQPEVEERQATQVILDELLALQSRSASLKVCTGDTFNSRRDCYNKATPSLSEQLSEREFEVVQLLVTGISIGEIAQQLILAEGTVKWYIKSIYSKLDVHSRMQLVIRAKDLGITIREEKKV